MDEEDYAAAEFGEDDGDDDTFADDGAPEEIEDVADDDLEELDDASSGAVDAFDDDALLDDPAARDAVTRRDAVQTAEGEVGRGGERRHGTRAAMPSWLPTRLLSHHQQESPGAPPRAMDIGMDMDPAVKAGPAGKQRPASADAAQQGFKGRPTQGRRRAVAHDRRARQRRVDVRSKRELENKPPQQTNPPPARTVWSEPLSTAEQQQQQQRPRLPPIAQPPASPAATGVGGAPATGASAQVGTDLTAGGMLDGLLYDLRAALQEDIRGLHLEVLRELEAQRHEMRSALQEERREMAALREENARLVQENRMLRGPMGGLPPPPPPST